jgi:hypothetical protein
LKQTAIKCGMDVPLYTVTGWGDGSIPENEVIPLWGGYPDESWTPDIEKIARCDNYGFNSFRDDATIGNAQVKKKEGYDYSLDPYFTCELGVGIFNSIHRRPVIGSLDGLALVSSRIGSGANLLGYYIFAGGSNPLGLYSTLEENKDETGYWSELSPISYDFQAAIRECGLPAPSYDEVKRMNYFLNEFGRLLAPMAPVFAPKSDAATGGGAAATLPGMQYAARVKGETGFLFGINYCRNNSMPERKQVRFQVKWKEKTMVFPSRAIDIPDSSIFIWPMGLNMDGTLLNYATAQPLYRTADGAVWVFVQDVDLMPEISLAEAGIEKVDIAAGHGEVAHQDGAYILTRLRPGQECVVTVTRKDGVSQKMVVLSKEEGKESWILADGKGKERFYVSRANLYIKDNTLCMTDTLANVEVSELRAGGNEGGGLFKVIKRRMPERAAQAAWKPSGALEDAQWLETGVKEIYPSTLLYHREFQKEFSAGDPARIKSAQLVLATESECRVRVNDKWVNQPIDTNRMTVLDVTGYVQKGDNVLLLDFPFEKGNKAFAARLLVEYFNTDRLDFSTDTSWLTSDLYYFPATYGDKPVYPLGLVKPQVAGREQAGLREALRKQALPAFKEWRLALDCHYLEGLNNLYLDTRYEGDRISVRYQGRLIADNLNNRTDWLMDLKRGGYSLECQELELEIRPWKGINKMYFDRAPLATEEGKAAIDWLRLVPEYRVEIPVEE